MTPTQWMNHEVEVTDLDFPGGIRPADDILATPLRKRACFNTLDNMTGHTRTFFPSIDSLSGLAG
ncbi:hypothetical protein ColTof4_13610 [Colletotrichum tofieldiae]|nr:hypothetical protein ColTof3_14562 [Colletotrichum tofieldiae]GKT81187.1 hypothetical protein ColTof4_13610 [Colletotrichum tofieldiae]